MPPASSKNENLGSGRQLLLIGIASILIFGCTAKPKPLLSNDAEFHTNFAAEYGILILPLMDEITLEVNSKYKLRCEANEPTEWRVANITQPFVVEAYKTSDPERPYGSMLHLTDISYFNVGHYFCIKASAMEQRFPGADEQELVELVNLNEASSIYIYVNDKDNLLVPINIPVGYANQYQDITIPCKPTMPNVEVLLTTPSGETYSSENTGRYDPKRGFVIEIRGLTDSGAYWCHPAVPSSVNEEEYTEYIIHFVGNEHIDLATTTSTKTTIITNTTTTAKTHSNERSSNWDVKSSGILNKKSTTTIEAVITTTATTPIKKSKTSKSTVTNIANDTNRISSLNIGGDVHASNRIKKIVPAIVNVGNGNGNMSIKNEVTADTTIADDSIEDYTETYYEDEGSPDHQSTSMPESAIKFIACNGTGHCSSGVGGNGAVVPSTGGQIRAFKKRAVRTTPSYSSLYKYRSTPRSSTKFVNKPTISSPTHGHAFEGESFNLICEVEIAHDVRYTTEWVTPNVDENRLERSDPTFNRHTDTHNLGRSVLTVKDAKKSDSGIYKCTVIDHSKNHAHNTYLMTILSQNESYINISEPNDYYVIKERSNKTVQITVKYRGYPHPTLTWYRPDGSEITPTRKHYIDTTDTSITLKILNAQTVDSGTYIIRAANGIITKDLQFNVSVSGPPMVSVEDVYVQAGAEANLTCRVLSYPPSLVSWVFTPCSITPRWPSCDKKLEQSFNSTRSSRPGSSSVEYLHDLYFTPSKPGIMHCIAMNGIGNSSGKGHVLIGDISDNMTVWTDDESRKIARDDEVIIKCAALAYYFSEDLNWYKDDEIVEGSEDIEITTSTSDYSYSKYLRFANIQDNHRGRYECRAREVNYHDRVESKYIDIFIHEPTAPKMLYTNLDPSSKINRKLGESLELECKSDAIPRADIAWYKNEVRLYSSENLAIQDGNSTLIIPFMKPEDDGIYKCVVSNRLGTVESSVAVKITDMPGLKLGWIIGTLILFAILSILVIYLIVRVKRERALLRELKAAGLANFEEGAVEHINPALTLDEQADLLPYDRVFEFPREKLKLGKQLGAGAFGVVLKAVAEGIRPDEKESVVAVKMVKRTADNEVMRALVSELKIMVHLGQHLNVVNLLGAVTKNIAKRELMVIVEYCRYGNVQNFLLRNRKRFINQVNTETDKIDPTITTQRFSDNFETNRDGLKYVSLSFTNHQYISQINNKNMNNNYTNHYNHRNSDNDPRSGTRAGRPNSRGYLRQSDLYEGQIDSCATEQTVMTTVPEDDDNVLSNNSVQPAWRSNYKTDSTEAMTITTSDLISWAFQVARGMDYLSSRKVLHGDLAARNILLCEENVVKICDFGLARSMYNSENYKKQGEAPLPIKWLALESLSDQVFSTYTDVWSFGIVLWEFFSLAKVPYPGMDPNQSLYLKLKDGYRMEKPPFANDELYDIMLECWSTNPESRPLFNVLEKRFARMLGDEVTNHYMDLNEPYLRINTENTRRSQTDYLALMGSPDELAPPPPRYVNGHVLPEIRIETSSDDYIQMSTNTGTIIFSPTRPKDYEIDSIDDDSHANTTTSFTFPDTDATQQHSPTLANNLDSPVTKHRRKDIVQPEEIPMLHNANNQSDNEQSPEQSRKYIGKVPEVKNKPTPSPRHHIAETQLTNDENYVNVIPPTKKVLNNNNNGRSVQDAFSNPSYQMIKTVKETEQQ